MSWPKDRVFKNGAEFVQWLDKNYGDYIFKHISQLHVHHTWKPNHSNYPAYTTLGLHKNMRHYHMNTRGWTDIGQHISIGRYGDVVTGLPITSMPASAFGHNGSSAWHPFMFEMIGDFDMGRDKLEGSQLETVLAISRYFHNKKGKPIKFHREMDPRKSCPGTGIDKSWFVNLVRSNQKVSAAPDRKTASIKITEPNNKTISQMADEVIAGKHGSGHSNRRISLGINQAEYEKVRAEVNRRVGVSTKSKPRKSISQMATEVIAGKHGNGHAARRKSLGISQAEYEKVRAEVNRRL